eukprot:scaffold538_cov412-Prasinococcus_capsulatus_cf.AAC.8
MRWTFPIHTPTSSSHEKSRQLLAMYARKRRACEEGRPLPPRGVSNNGGVHIVRPRGGRCTSHHLLSVHCRFLPSGPAVLVSAGSVAMARWGAELPHSSRAAQLASGHSPSPFPVTAATVRQQASCA